MKKPRTKKDLLNDPRVAKIGQLGIEKESDIIWQESGIKSQRINMMSVVIPTYNEENNIERCLIALNDQIEEADVERVKALAALAQLRNISITDLMDELGLLPPSYA